MADYVPTFAQHFIIICELFRDYYSSSLILVAAILSMVNFMFTTFISAFLVRTYYGDIYIDRLDY